MNRPMYTIYAYFNKRDGTRSKRRFVLARFALSIDAFRYIDQTRKENPTWFLTMKGWS